MSELVPTAARFLGRVDDYARYRPSYPAEAIDALFLGLGDPTSLTVADVGAGTGISSRLLAARGAKVIAIEPNPEMRAAAADLDVRDATAERTGLGDASVDAVFSFQAFHWFATPAAVREFARIVRSGGRLGLVWNVRDDRDPLTKAYGLIADLDSSAARRAGQANDEPGLASLLKEPGFRDVRTLEFPYAQQLDLEGLLGRARSASYVPSEGPEHDEIMHGLMVLHGRFADLSGNVWLRYRTHVHLAEHA